MSEAIDIVGDVVPAQSDFPNAVNDWTPGFAVALAKEEGLALNEDSWELVRSLQSYFARHEGERINVQELSAALEEKFHIKGGKKFLYQLFPAGPISQGCRIAGLELPPFSIDQGFGSSF